MKNKGTIVFFYKSLLDAGGAERLLINSYLSMKKLGYNVKVVSYIINEKALFNSHINKDDFIELSSRSFIGKFTKLCNLLKNHKESKIICDSGHIDIYLASIFVNFDYSLHLHHPLFMSFNDFDKYSIFLKSKYNYWVNSNYGAIRFNNIKNKLTYFDKILINIRAFFSILSIKKAKNIFVLSKYAFDEKKSLFNVNSKIICGALDSELFNKLPQNSIDKFDTFEYKILTIARLDENKRIDQLIFAVNSLVKKNYNLCLIIGGRGPEYENLKNIVERLNLSDNIYFLGFIQEEFLYGYYSLADLFVSIDWADYRITSYESMLAGTPVVLSNEVEYDDYLIRNKYLFTCSPNAKELEVLLEQKLQLKNTELKFSINDYLENFTWDNYVKQIISFL